jgi:hypothetical protein
MKLLTIGNAKTVKGEARGYLTFILHLAPARLSGYNVCPGASAGCIAGCLNTAGRGGMFKRGENTNAIQEARIRRTRFFFEDREAFMRALVSDVRKGIKQAERKGLIPVFRLNGTSDIRWESVEVDGFRNIMEAFPTIQWYDYTKLTNRRHLPSNYHLTFSRSETNVIPDGMNVAVVFQSLPETFAGRPVINGDDTDLRFLDPTGVIVGLKAKGRAKKDTSGFVVRT